ncbi:MAG: transposase [Gammaproteobacteria bacterium]|nr:transposase [Gammaproteobacteria bacterium]MYD79352.1 transposase [Gammaproteobacteria bacterium]
MDREVRNVTYRLLPCTKAKAHALSRLAGACRFVWNATLDEQDRLLEIARREGGEKPSTSFFSLGTRFKSLRDQTPWLRELPYAPVRYALKHQSDAWRRFFDGKGGRPRFKARRGDDGVTIPDKVRIFRGRIRIPRLGWYVLRRHGGNPYPDGIAKQARVTRSCGRWYCTVSYEVDIEEPLENGLALGMDRNAGQVALSTGDIVPLTDLARHEARKRRYQRMMARREDGSNRKRKARHLVAKSSRKIARKRRDWCHQVSRMCADTASEVVIEDLDIRAMTSSARGTADEPGTNVKAKSGLNRAILSSGWGLLEGMLSYKTRELTKVPAPYTSQTCHACGHRNSENRKSQSRFECAACGHEGNADVNAALNILASGSGATGRRGALALATPMIRQHLHCVANNPTPNCN